MSKIQVKQVSKIIKDVRKMDGKGNLWSFAKKLSEEFAEIQPISINTNWLQKEAVPVLFREKFIIVGKKFIKDNK